MPDESGPPTIGCDMQGRFNALAGSRDCDLDISTMGCGQHTFCWRGPCVLCKMMGLSALADADPKAPAKLLGAVFRQLLDGK